MKKPVNSELYEPNRIPSPGQLPESVVVWRRRQVLSVAVGSCGALLLLLGMMWIWGWLFWMGVGLFAAALVSVLLFGWCAARASQSSRKLVDSN